MGSIGRFSDADLDSLAREPLDRYVRDALMLWGRAKGFDRVVACVPDALLASIPRIVDGAQIDLDALSDEIETAGCETLTKQNVLIVRPKNPLQEEARRLDRRPLSALCRSAAKGTFGFDDLIAYHAAYANGCDCLDLLPQFERPIRSRYALDRSLNWSLPHALLATLGKLSSVQRAELFQGRGVSLKGPAFAGCLSSLAQLATFNSNPAPPRRETFGSVTHSTTLASASGSNLDRSPTRLLAKAGDHRMLAAPGKTVTVVRRVSKASGEIVDEDFIPIELAASVAKPSKVSAAQMLDRYLRLLWTQERSPSIRVSLG